MIHMNIVIKAQVYSCIDGKKSYSSEIDDGKTFGEVYEIIEKSLHLDTSSVTRVPKVYVDGLLKEPIDGFVIRDFLQANDIADSTIIFDIQYGGIGASESLDGPLKIEIRSAEDCHKCTPHAHITDKSINGTVSIKLDDCSILEGREDWERFSRKDKRDIERLLSEYRLEFIEFYNQPVLKGSVPDPVDFVFRGKRHTLCYKQVEPL